jgi:hypothetical protein
MRPVILGDLGATPPLPVVAAEKAHAIHAFVLAAKNIEKKASSGTRRSGRIIQK